MYNFCELKSSGIGRNFFLSLHCITMYQYKSITVVCVVLWQFNGLKEARIQISTGGK